MSENLKVLQVFIASPNDLADVAVIVTEVTHRRTEARRLRSSAGAEWVRAKVRFEQELLGKP